MSAADALAAIHNQTVASRPNDTFVIEVLSTRFPSFTIELQQELERYQSLQMLTFNSCGIKSLEFFPSIPSLIRLDLVMNEITGPELVHLQGCRHLQTIMLGGNKIEKTDDLIAFKGMKQLFQISLLSNPIQSEAGYRVKVFSMFPSLTVLDGLDNGGKDAFSATSMANTTSRVPATLFDTSPPVHSTSLFSGFPTGSLFSASSRPIPLPPALDSKVPRKSTASRAISPSIPPKAGKAGKAGKSGKRSKVSSVGSSRTMSSRAGLVFPVGRIRRHLKTSDPLYRIGKGSAVFMAAVLEYLTA